MQFLCIHNKIAQLGSKTKILNYVCGLQYGDAYQLYIIKPVYVKGRKVLPMPTKKPERGRNGKGFRGRPPADGSSPVQTEGAAEAKVRARIKAKADAEALTEWLALREEKEG